MFVPIDKPNGLSCGWFETGCYAAVFAWSNMARPCSWAQTFRNRSVRWFKNRFHFKLTSMIFFQFCVNFRKAMHQQKSPLCFVNSSTGMRLGEAGNRKQRWSIIAQWFVPDGGAIELLRHVTVLSVGAWMGLRDRQPWRAAGSGRKTRPFWNLMEYVHFVVIDEIWREKNRSTEQIKFLVLIYLPRLFSV